MRHKANSKTSGLCLRAMVWTCAGLYQKAVLLQKGIYSYYGQGNGMPLLGQSNVATRELQTLLRKHTAGITANRSPLTDAFSQGDVY